MDRSNLLSFPPSSPLQDRACSVSSPRSVFCVGRDPETLLRLEKAIRSPSDLKVRRLSPLEAEAWARTAEPRLWIFCPRIELAKLVHLACTVRRYSPTSRLILLCRSQPGFEATLFHRILRPDATESLLEVVSRLAVTL